VKRPTTPAAILAAATEVWGVSPLSYSRRSQAVGAKQTSVMLMRRATEGYSLPEIGRFVGRDHTTVLHSVRRAEQRMDDSRFAAMVRLVANRARELGARVPEIWEE
jgi:chromosomal replication initiation ATPase DnaA